MSLRLKQSKSPAHELRRMCRSRVARARKRLVRDASPTSVHGVRKEIKRVRAVLRLMRNKSGNEANRQASRALRQAAGCLSASRDARVMLRAFERLAAGAVKKFPKLHEALRQHCRQEARSLQSENELPKAIRLLRKARHKFRLVKLQVDDWTGFAPGLEHGFDRAKKMYKTAQLEPVSKNLHRWRKRVKSLWYQLCLIRSETSGSVRALVDKLELLGDQLGEEHDLALLKKFVARRDRREERMALSPLIEARCEKLRRRVLAAGKEIFSGGAVSLSAHLNGARKVHQKKSLHGCLVEEQKKRSVSGALL